MAAAQPNLFVPYIEMPERPGPRAWRVIRWSLLGLTGLTVAASFVKPDLGLLIFWKLFVPLAPIVFLVMPGIWRNVCPMASLNQLPRTVGFTRGLAVPLRVQQYTPLVSAGLFLLLVPLRKVVLDRNGVALGLFMLTALGLALAGGTIFKGKSGWCSQFCPMLQVERLYGQSPLLVVRNSHCRPCVGCNKNCYDFNPTAAYLADLHDENPRLGINRRLFAGALPWLVAAFFTQPYLDSFSWMGLLGVYARLLLFVSAGVGTFFVLENVSGLSGQKLALLHAAAAIVLFYGFVAPLALVAVVPLSVWWLRRAWPRERAFLQQAAGAPAKVADHVLTAHGVTAAGSSEVTFAPGPTVLARGGQSLLDVAESNHVAIESGCRMGMCGADPVCILAGAENLSPMTSSERSTLERLGLAPSWRLACSARVRGPVQVSTSPTAAPLATAGDGHPTGNGEKAMPAFKPAADVHRVVVIGNGAAGMTAANELRKLGPDLQIDVFGKESYDYYNRMSITKLVSESTAIDKLYLLPGDWAKEKRINFVRAVDVVGIATATRKVMTEDGKTTPYDRLILAPGAEAVRPEIEGFGVEGSFVMRTIDDAVQVQQYLRRQRAKRAVVVGGGLLGLEVAHNILATGVRVIVLDRGAWPLGRQLDETGGGLLHLMLSELGIEILPNSSARKLVGALRLRYLELPDGSLLETDACVVAAGISPNVELARVAGLQVGRGIQVDDRMQTSDSRIYAAGDAIELVGKGFGLWPAAVDQGRVAAVNALGGDAHFQGVTPPAKLKVAAIDLLSVGEVSAGQDEQELVLHDPSERSYRKLVLRQSKAVGAILISHSELFDPVVHAVENRIDLGPHLDRLRAGDWSCLEVSDLAHTVG